MVTQMSRTMLQSLGLSNIGGIIMVASIITGLMGIISALLANACINRGKLKELKQGQDSLSKEHTNLERNLSKEHASIESNLSKEHANLESNLSKEHALLQRQFSNAQNDLRHLCDESIRMEGFRKDVEKQGINASELKASIDLLIQKDGESVERLKELSQNMRRTERLLEETKLSLRNCKEELLAYKQENRQLKQQIYNLQHPHSWDEVER